MSFAHFFFFFFFTFANKEIYLHALTSNSSKPTAAGFCRCTHQLLIVLVNTQKVNDCPT